MHDVADLRDMAKALGVTVSDPYRMALGYELHRAWTRAKARKWRSVRRSLLHAIRRLPRRSEWIMWRCEGDICHIPRHGLTARAAERRMLLDAIGEALGRRSEHQRKRATAVRQ